MNQLRERLDDQNLDEFAIYEGGATLAIAFQLGFAHGLRDNGVDLKGVHSLATSGGVWARSALATDLEFETLASQPQIRLFDQTPNYMFGYAKELYGNAHDKLVNATMTDILTMQLHIRNGGKRRLAKMAVQSSAVPGAFFPAIGSNRLWWDGAVARLSPGYAHMAPRAKKLIVLGALNEHIRMPLGPFTDIPGKVLEGKSKFDRDRWQKRNPLGQVIYFGPGPEIGAMIKNPKHLFDFDIARDIYPMAREQAAEVFDENSPRYCEAIAEIALRNTQLPA